MPCYKIHLDPPIRRALLRAVLRETDANMTLNGSRAVLACPKGRLVPIWRKAFGAPPLVYQFAQVTEDEARRWLESADVEEPARALAAARERLAGLDEQRAAVVAQIEALEAEIRDGATAQS